LAFDESSRLNQQMKIGLHEKSGNLKRGSRVRLIGVPDGLDDCNDLRTKSTFEKCLGGEFVVAGFNDVEMAELDVGSVTGSLGETVWVEPEFLEVLPNQSAN
jgi:hypothetical protein